MFQQWRTNSIDSQTVASHHHHPMSHSPAHFRLMYVAMASLVLSSCATLSPLQSPLGVGPPLGGPVGVARRAGRLVQCGRRATLAGSSARSGVGPGAVGGFWLRRSTLLYAGSGRCVLSLQSGRCAAAAAAAAGSADPATAAPSAAHRATLLSPSGRPLRVWLRLKIQTMKTESGDWLILKPALRSGKIDPTMFFGSGGYWFKAALHVARCRICGCTPRTK